MHHRTRELIGFVMPPLTLLLALAVLGAPVLGIDVPPVQLAGASLVATSSVVVMVVATNRGDDDE